MNSSKPVVKIVKSGVRFNAWDANGKKFTSQITTGARKKAFEGNYTLGRFVDKNGKHYWRRWDGGEVSNIAVSSTDLPSIEVPTDHEEVLNFIHSSYSLKPRNLMMSELKWKYLVRSGVRGKNIINK